MHSVPCPQAFGQGLVVIAAQFDACTIEASRRLEQVKAELRALCNLPDTFSAALSELFELADNANLNGCFKKDVVETIIGAQCGLDSARCLCR